MNNTSHIELSKSAMINNLSFLKTLFDDKVKISSVVKGNAYGHGIKEFVPMAEELGINHFSVYSADEARLVLDATVSDQSEVMIMGYIETEDLQWAIKSNISMFVFDFDRLIKVSEIATELGTTARVHIELETGMNRTGFSSDELEMLPTILKINSENLRFEGLCTHFAGAESIANHERVQKQKALFIKMSNWLEKQGLIPEMKHTCCSAASIRLPKMQFDMVRIGILQYGFWPSREIFIEYLDGKKTKEDPLKRIISWKSQIMNVKNIKAGEFIGYGTTCLAQKNMVIANIPIGYSHGFSRALSNYGRVLIRGFRVPVVGMVNMNSMAVDVSEIPNVQKGDEVTLIGQDKELEISVSSFGELSDQLNYELLTRLPIHIPRVVN
ncbi:MAG: alanine racemase [Cyclobacteriaceae bacterium]|jgi:alanine racemase